MKHWLQKVWQRDYKNPKRVFNFKRTSIQDTWFGDSTETDEDGLVARPVFQLT